MCVDRMRLRRVEGMQSCEWSGWEGRAANVLWLCYGADAEERGRFADWLGICVPVGCHGAVLVGREDVHDNVDVFDSPPPLQVRDSAEERFHAFARDAAIDLYRDLLEVAGRDVWEELQRDVDGGRDHS